MSIELWQLICLTLFFGAVQCCLGGRSRRSLEEARMLPFADDPDVARRMELATRRSRSGCECPGPCDGGCAYLQRLEI
jgi:cbb3-type cytochrome oxidase subunit 3